MTESTAWPGPPGDAWEAANAKLQTWVDSYNWDDWYKAYQEHMGWAYNALTEITAYACELPDEELAALETDRRAHPDFHGKSMIRARSNAAQFTRRSEEIMAATQGNLTQLRSLGIAPYDAGLAVVAQGLLHDLDSPDDAEFLAGPWIRRGHPFPRPARRVSLDDYPAA